jgi:hypothetical protein
MPAIGEGVKTFGICQKIGSMVMELFLRSEDENTIGPSDPV